MTLKGLQIELTQRQSLAECDEFLQANLHEIRPLFYGLTRAQLQEHYLDFENVFYSFTNSSAGQAIRTGEDPPASVTALLIFFLSLFERAHLYTVVLAVADLIPAGPLRQQIEALFKYKNIENAATDYLDRFDSILRLLQEARNSSAKDLGSSLSEYLLQEYVLDAFLEPLEAGINIRPAITASFLEPSAQLRYPILLTVSAQTLLNADEDEISRKRSAIRSDIVENLHSQACELVPNCLLTRLADEFVGEIVQPVQTLTRIPEFLNDQLDQMGAVYSPQRQGVRTNFDADAAQNLIYLGTYFPRTVIETWNIYTELLSIPIIQAAIRQKNVIRLLDVGSGTGGAIVGTLLALSDWGQYEAVVEVTSIDVNQDALERQGEILGSLRNRLPFKLVVNPRYANIPFDLEGFIPAFTDIVNHEGCNFDLITCWKFLSEFYNVNFAAAQGIIRNTLGIASRRLSPYGLCVVADVTTTDNGFEFFAITLNREANKHDAGPDAETRTILPLPCGRSSATCDEGACYTQRRFQVSHQLELHDETKIAYRVLTSKAFAHSITASFTNHEAYQVNAARPAEVCCNGRKREETGAQTCGYTGFLA
jgi:SAM-dependent methyltransferase